jgi:CheY-like chemotaxis protein
VVGNVLTVELQPEPSLDFWLISFEGEFAIFENPEDLESLILTAVWPEVAGDLVGNLAIELPRLGHEATVCPDGRTAVAALDRTAYDCVIVDLDMPGVGGLEVIARVRETSPDTETVIITGKSSVETAIEAVVRDRFDMILMDIQMPGMSGIEATRMIRAMHGAVARTPIVGLSANAMEGDGDAFIGAGMDDYITKPIDIPRLRATIDRFAVD